MNEFFDLNNVSDIGNTDDIADTNNDFPKLSDLPKPDTTEFTEVQDSKLDTAEMTEAQKAAEYARSFDGMEKAADYIQNNYCGGEFNEDIPIQVKTRNMALEGIADTTVPYERRTVELTPGLNIDGVFPNFSNVEKYHTDLGSEANDMSLHKQFKACKEDFQLHLFDDPHTIKGLTLEDMDCLTKNNGYAPEGWTWNHNPEIGEYSLVPYEIHARNGHTGSNAFMRGGKK